MAAEQALVGTSTCERRNGGQTAFEDHSTA